MDITFAINGIDYKVDPSQFPCGTPLLTFIRQNANLTGTKSMCHEGGCGACVVMLTRTNPVTQKTESFAVNSCLKSLFSCHQQHITTVEGIAYGPNEPHPLQHQIVRTNGSQCGYCTSGILMNMYSLMAEHPDSSMRDIERSFDGNICRCTGYVAILEAIRPFASDATAAMVRSCRDPDLLDMDIEDLAPVRFCAKRGRVPCSGGGQCPADENNNVAEKIPPMSLGVVFDGPNTWYRAQSVADVQTVWQRLAPGAKYQLVAGNTARGICGIGCPPPDLSTFIDISGITELQTSRQTAQTLSIGAACTISTTIAMLRTAAQSDAAGFKYCDPLADHLEKVANLPVRNAASLAGNMCYKKCHPEFPSDIFTALLAAGAQLTIVDAQNQQTVVPVGDEFLALDMDRKLVYNVLLPRFDANTLYGSYKVMQRKQNCHAYVNAAFWVRMAAGKVAQARLCFGGISDKCTHAAATEKMLIGRELFTNQTIQAVLQSLDRELVCTWKLPESSGDYRRSLAKAVTYRFLLANAPVHLLSDANRSCVTDIERPLSTSTHTWQVDEAEFPISQPLPKYAAMSQATGEARYVNDMPRMVDELFVGFVLATKCHAKIAAIDASVALKMPGVVCFKSAGDIPHKNCFTPSTIFTPFSEPIMCGINETVLYNGQLCGILAATTQEQAHQAAECVKITYIKSVDDTPAPDAAGGGGGGVFSLARSFLSPLLGDPPEKPVIATLACALRQNDPRRFHQTVEPLVAKRRGLNATRTVAGTFAIAGQAHYTMEPQTAICVPAEDGGLKLYCSTQWMELAQMAVSKMLGIPEHKIDIEVNRLGGGYGAKISRSSLFACVAALLCHQLRRPIRVVVSMAQNMRMCGKRFGLSADYSATVDDDGCIQSLVNKFTQDAGCSLNESVNGITQMAMGNGYITDIWSVAGQCALTDCASNTFFRCPGSLEGIAMTECLMDHIRCALKLDEVAVRLANMPADSPMRALFKQFVEETDYYNCKAAVDAFNACNKWRKRGIALMPMVWQAEYFGCMPASVCVHHGDGSVVIQQGGIEMGQGIYTKVAQVAARLLGVPMELVSVKPSNNATSTNAFCSGGSVTSESACFAVQKCCEELLERMKSVRDTLPPGYEWCDLTNACHTKQIDMRTMYQFKTTDMEGYPVYAMVKCETELCVLTGCYQLRKVDLWEDVGDKCVNPQIDMGQVEGAFVMGCGYWTTEDLLYDVQNGELMTDCTWSYKPPGMMDGPVDFNVKFLQNGMGKSGGFLRSKAVGEPATALAYSAVISLGYAIRAHKTACGATDDLWFQMGSGNTPEKIFQHCGIDWSTCTL